MRKQECVQKVGRLQGAAFKLNAERCEARYLQW